jgi:hypothetical protein
MFITLMIFLDIDRKVIRLLQFILNNNSLQSIENQTMIIDNLIIITIYSQLTIKKILCTSILDRVC